ncbi:MAG: GNAT family N-acetyltransferase [Campylobacter sp.]|nr:GNAT family N-acetyltransferase [Campylobacter sp.]
MSILKNFCRYILKDEILKYQTEIGNMNTENYKLNCILKQQEKFFELCNTEFNKTTPIKIDKDKIGNYCLLCMSNDTIWLKGVDFSPRLYFKTTENKIKIQDIQTHPKYENKGHSSLLLDCLIQYAKKNDIEEICGDLDPGGNLERRKHFYEKFGFTIHEREKEFDKILLKLN